MPFDRNTLEAAIRTSGGAQQPADQVDGLMSKLQALEATGRYGALRGIIQNACQCERQKQFSRIPAGGNLRSPV